LATLLAGFAGACGILDCRCVRRSASGQVGTDGWSPSIEQRDAAIDLNLPAPAPMNQFAELGARN
jgi:hypothetical protein